MDTPTLDELMLESKLSGCISLVELSICVPLTRWGLHFPLDKVGRPSGGFMMFIVRLLRGVPSLKKVSLFPSAAPTKADPNFKPFSPERRCLRWQFPQTEDLLCSYLSHVSRKTRHCLCVADASSRVRMGREKDNDSQ